MVWRSVSGKPLARARPQAPKASTRLPAATRKARRDTTLRKRNVVMPVRRSQGKVPRPNDAIAAAPLAGLPAAAAVASAPYTRPQGSQPQTRPAAKECARSRTAIVCRRRQSGAPSRSSQAAAPEKPARYRPTRISIKLAAPCRNCCAGAAPTA